MPSSLVLFEKDGTVIEELPDQVDIPVRRWNLWYVVVSAALGYALSWLVGDGAHGCAGDRSLCGRRQFPDCRVFQTLMADGSSTDPIGGNGPQLLTLAANEADTESSGSVHLPPMDEMSVGASRPPSSPSARGPGR